MALRTLSLCTGEAGIELGLHVAGIECAPICYVEHEAYAAANLARLIDAGALPDAPFRSDVRTLCDADFRAFMEGVELDLLTGGYPCQPFSCAGKQRGKDDPRHLWPWIAEAIGAYRPEVCFFENVPAHLKLGYPQVRADLRSMGYRVTEGLFTAGELGCGHKRERLFILAVANDERGECEPKRFGRGLSEIRQRGADDTMPPAKSRGNVADGQHMRTWAGEQGIEGDAPGYRRDRLADRGPAMADAEGSKQHDRFIQQAHASKDGFGIGVFPPGPGELEQWAGILADYPHLAPALEPGFCGLVDGLSVDVGRHRSHRLRLHGNAVVPLVAAYAWIFLWADLLYGTGGR